MGPNLCYLITLCDGEQIIKVALKAEREVQYYMEPDGRAQLYAQLPMHCRTFGKIVHVEELFEIEIKPEVRQ